ncbi:MAG: ammonium transporter [Acidimicrobiales bacterium]
MSTDEIDLLWVVFSMSLVLLMQAGFLFLEAGMTRAKNSINVAVKNIVDFGMAIVLFWVFGYALMFGDSSGGWFGTSGFGLDLSISGPEVAVFLLFQAVFAGTTVTIISGAVAERMHFGAYLGVVAIMAVVYPVAGHWVWNGDGWLTGRGFVDFAGSTVVHSVGGWAALAAAIVVGPRLGRFAADGTPIPINPSNLPMAMFGTLVLWFGWLGFNGGSTLAFDETVPSVLANTILGGAAGLMAAFAVGWALDGVPHAAGPLNGALGGLVGVTAGAHVLSTRDALIVGAIGGLVALGCERLLVRRRIDDAVGAIPVHLGAGIWGTLAVGLFGSAEVLGFDSRTGQVVDQVTGIVAIGVFAFGVPYVAFRVMDSIIGMRVPPDDEQRGLNVAEHAATTELIDLLEAMDEQTTTGRIAQPLAVEPFTEVGQVATLYNRLTDQLRRTADAAASVAAGDLTVSVPARSADDEFNLSFERMVADLDATISLIVASTGGLVDASVDLDHLATTIGSDVGDLDGEFTQVAANMAEVRDGAVRADAVSRRAMELAEGHSSRLLAAMDAVGGATGEIEGVVESIAEIADRTKLLALNATIEAARAGDAGKGFAVVAAEVGALATEALRSLDQVNAAMDGLRTHTEAAAGEAGAMAEEMVTLTAQTCEEISAAASSAEREADTVVALAARLRSLASGNDGRSVVASLAQCSEVLAAAARDLRDRVGHFRTRSVQGPSPGGRHGRPALTVPSRELPAPVG